MWHFSKGYVIIRLEGTGASRLLKRMTDAGVRVSRIHRTEDGTIRLTMPSGRFKTLHRLSRGLRVKVHIIRRGGLRFTCIKLFRRPVLWIGTAALLVGMIVLSGRIWVIRIEGTERIDPVEITELLKEHGVYTGATLKGPVLITAANDLAARIRDAAHISLDRDGILLRVTVVESIQGSPKKTTRVPSDVIAEKDGVVLSVSVMRGQARVGVGDRVKAGDVLISGTVLYLDERYETNADGTVTAAVEYRTERKLEDSVTEVRETDREETVRILRFADRIILRNEPTFEHCRLTDSGTVSVSPYLPLTIEMLTAREIGFFERSISDEEAEQIALSGAREDAYALVPRDAAIINTYGTIRKRNGVRYAVAIVTAEETIGKTEEEPHDG